MTDERAELQARVNSLAPDAWEEQVSVNEAILRLQAGDLVATRRLALALVKLGEFDRAEDVVQEALVLHPADDILTRRAEDIARGRRTAAAETRIRSSVEQAPSTWIKAVHYDGDGWTESEGTELWISDPGQRDASGDRLYTATGEPWVLVSKPHRCSSARDYEPTLTSISGCVRRLVSRNRACAATWLRFSFGLARPAPIAALYRRSPIATKTASWAKPYRPS